MFNAAMSDRGLSALSSLGPDESVLVVFGPWLALAYFSSCINSYTRAWRVGPVSPDEYRAGLAPSATAHGASRLELRALCPMGAGLGALQSISGKHSKLVFALACRDSNAPPEDQVENYWIERGSIQRFAGDPIPQWLSLILSQAPEWARLDALTAEWLNGLPCPQGFLEAAGFGASGVAAPAFLLEAARLLARSPASDPRLWADWPDTLRDLWLWPSTPWTPAPPWPGQDELSLGALGKMIAAEYPAAFVPYASARRYLDILSHWHPLAPESALRELAGAISQSRAPSFIQAWRSALSLAPLGAANLFAQACSEAGLSISYFFDSAQMLELCQRKSCNAMALFSGAPWGFSHNELLALASLAPPEISSLLESRVLQDSTGGSGSQASSAGARRL